MKPPSSISNHLSILFLISRVVVGYNNGLAQTPQMGWNTWNRFGCDIDEELVVESAKFVAEKLKVYGYECTYHSPIFGRLFTSLHVDIVMDDCPRSFYLSPSLSITKPVTPGWHDVSRDPDTGAPRADPERFPSGIKAISDKVHALGLKARVP